MATGLDDSELIDLVDSLSDGWRLVDGRHLRKDYIFPNFKLALAFVNQVGDYAERVGHHPDIYLAWGKVGIEVWTHTFNGLSPKDFALAEHCDTLIA
jgi:4a-hydroxytetrahydrobiopterin dehydratase